MEALSRTISLAETIASLKETELYLDSWIPSYAFEKYSIAENLKPIPANSNKKPKKQTCLQNLINPPNSRLTIQQHCFQLTYNNGLVRDIKLNDRILGEIRCFKTWVKAVCSMHRGQYLDCSNSMEYIKLLVSNKRNSRIQFQFEELESNFSIEKQINYSSKMDVSFAFEKTLLGTGHGNIIDFPNCPFALPLTLPVPRPFSDISLLKNDHHIKDMLLHVKPAICISISSLKAIFGSFADPSSKFEIPFEMEILNDSKAIVFETPLVNSEWTPRKMSATYYKKKTKLISIGESSSSREYQLWKFGDLKIIVRSNVRIRSSKRVCLDTKIEYVQREEMTARERAEWWITSLFNSKAPVVVAMVNVNNNTLSGTEDYSFETLLGDGNWIKPHVDGMYQLLKALSSLNAGKYLVRKTLSNRFSILKPADKNTLNNAYVELRKSFMNMHDISKFEFEPLFWRNIPGQVPYTFPPVQISKDFLHPPKLIFCNSNIHCKNEKCEEIHLDWEDVNVLLNPISPFYFMATHKKEKLRTSF
jgi:hypothetical protein